MEDVREAMEKFIELGDEAAMENMSFEDAEEGARWYVLWATMRPILRSYPMLLERIDKMEMDLWEVKTDANNRWRELTNDLVRINTKLNLLLDEKEASKK